MQQFTEYFDWLLNPSTLWVLQIFLVVFATLLIGFFAWKIVIRLEDQSKKTKTVWDDAFFVSIKVPLKIFIFVLGLSSAAMIAASESTWLSADIINTVRRVGLIFIVVWFLRGFIKQAEKNLSDPNYLQKPMDKTTAMALGKLLRLSIMITGVLVAIQSLGYSISGVLAFGGIGGIAVGFAAKDLLANFFGGLMVYLDRPFKVGDWIRSPDKNIEGTVEEIGWRLTRIRTFDKRPLYVPNSTFTQISVENPSRMLNRRIYETIGLRCEDAQKMHLVIDNVKKMLASHNDIDSKLTLIVNLNSFSSSSLDFFIYCFTKTTDWVEYHKVKQDVLLQVLNVIDQAGAECAFPTTTLHVPSPLNIDMVS